MRKSNLVSMLHNLSAMKFIYPLACDTALGQLDHYFCTIGNGINYHPQRGLEDEDYVTRKMHFIAENHKYDFAPAIERRDARRESLQKEYNKMLELFGENVPPQIGDVFTGELSRLSSDFEVMAENYYFDPETVGKEMVEEVRVQIETDRHGRLPIRTPYPISKEHSIICKMTRDDNPITVRLAIAMSKAWLYVLAAYIENEWYISDEDVEKYQGDSYYYSLKYINTCIDNFNNIIKNLETQND